jgi:hypothetical protein
MSRQTHRDLTLDVPEDWEDKSMTAFAPRRASPAAIQPSLVVTREPFVGDVSLRAFASQQLATVARSVPEFELTETRDETVGGLPAVVSDFTWQGDTGALAQRHVLVAFGRWVYAITYSRSAWDAGESLPAFDRILSSVAFDRSAS